MKRKSKKKSKWVKKASNELYDEDTANDDEPFDDVHEETEVGPKRLRRIPDSDSD